MTKLYLLFISFLYVTNANAITICGIDLGTTPEISYGTIDRSLGFGVVNWAVGMGCADTVDNETPVNEMCDKVYVAGRAGIGASLWTDINENMLTGSGSWCWCRRTHTMTNGVLKESLGQWVMISSQSNCSKACANSVATNFNGLRNPIMLLPAE